MPYPYTQIALSNTVGQMITLINELVTEVNTTIDRSGDTILAANGTISAPGVSFNGDQNNGLALTAADTVALVANSVAKITANHTFISMSVPTLSADGSVSSPGISFSSATSTGFYFGSGQLNGTIAGTNRYQFSASAFYAPALALDFQNGDVFLTRDAAGAFAQRNGTNPQTFRVYNTYTSDTNFERVSLRWDTNEAYIGTRGGADSGGTGTKRNLIIEGANVLIGVGSTPTRIWQFASSGHLLAVSDNTYDIGASAANRPRLIYTAAGGLLNDIAVASTAGAVNARLLTVSNGIVRLTRDDTNDFSRLILGTNDSSGVAIKKNGTTLQVRLGNDSGDASLTAAQVYSSVAFNSALTTGTLLTNDSQSVADNGVILVAPASAIATLFVVNDEDAMTGQFRLRGGNPTAVVDGPTYFSATKDNATTVNVYYDASGPSGAGYYLQNKRGASRTIRLIRIGT